MGGNFRRAGLAAMLVGFALAIPAAASADDAFVDVDTGSDTDPCTEAEPCETIQAGVDATGDGETTHVDPGTYASQDVTVGDGKSVMVDDFISGGGGNATVSVNGFPVVNILGTGAGTISGFLFTSFSATPVVNIAGPVQFENNTVNVPTTNGTGISVGAGGTDVVSIASSSFNGDNTSNTHAIVVDQGDVSISNNQIGSGSNGFNIGIGLETVGAPVGIFGNRFRAMLEAGSVEGRAIDVTDADPTITANSVRESGAGTVVAVRLTESGNAITTGADLIRNEFYGQGLGSGIVVSDTEGEVSLDGDLIAGFAQAGIRTTDVGADSASAGNVSITGATFWDNGVGEIELDDADLVMDSTITETGVESTGTVSCTIMFSRGATDVPGGDGCGDFQTTDDPEFVDPTPTFGDPDLHLTAASPMIDAGNPGDPNVLLDIDGGPRLADGDQQCPEELARDIGADEFGDAPLDCDPPETKIKGKRKTTKERARFKLRSDEASSTFRCKLDKGRFRRCKARHRTKPLDPGKHKLKAKAIDAAGNEDPSAAVKRFKVIAG